MCRVRSAAGPLALACLAGLALGAPGSARTAVRAPRFGYVRIVIRNVPEGASAPGGDRRLRQVGPTRPDAEPLLCLDGVGSLEFARTCMGTQPLERVLLVDATGRRSTAVGSTLKCN